MANGLEAAGPQPCGEGFESSRTGGVEFARITKMLNIMVWVILNRRGSNPGQKTALPPRPKVCGNQPPRSERQTSYLDLTAEALGTTVPDNPTAPLAADATFNARASCE